MQLARLVLTRLQPNHSIRRRSPPLKSYNSLHRHPHHNHRDFSSLQPKPNTHSGGEAIKESKPRTQRNEEPKAGKRSAGEEKISGWRRWWGWKSIGLYTVALFTTNYLATWYYDHDDPWRHSPLYVLFLGHYQPRPFDPPKFTPFTIVDKEEVSPTSFIITLRPKFFGDFAKNPLVSLVPRRIPVPSDPYVREWKKGTWSVEFKQPQLQIARSYTPLPPREHDTIGNLRFLIRVETDGEMSRYLARLPVGGEIELRGPHTEFELPQEVTDVVFLAGGTGIAPALQVAHTLLEVRRPTPVSPKIHIIWANRRREDCIGGTDSNRFKAFKQNHKQTTGRVVQELQRLQEMYPNNVTVDYLVDEEGSTLDAKKISQLTKKDYEVKTSALITRIDSKMLFVSGPEGFVTFLAGPKKYLGGKEVQGDLGGLIGRAGIKDWKVWKQ